MEYITLKISAQALNTIGAALGELPFKIASPVIDEIQKQVDEYERSRDKTSTDEKSDVEGSS